MKKTTRNHSNKLTQKLLQYSALSVALAGVSEASGQIIYTDVDPDITEGNAASATFIDLNNDGTDDFGIGTIDAPAVGFNGINPTDSWLGSAGTYLYPFALNAGDPISSGQTTWYGSGAVGTLNYTSCYNGIGGSNWCGVTDKYLGLRFNIGLDTHYGWARLDVSASGDSMTLKDFAYNSTPGEAINAGQTSLSVEEFSADRIKIVSLNKSIGLYNIPEATAYRLLDMSGKSVLSGSTNGSSYVIEGNNLTTGVYIIEISDANSKGVIRKKVVL
ncbi:T9SS type A sorting domain-containing protein [uncultured Psychroserpens sp.]|uniref:T9SS type A sorting domain-containing protein n=1 Tax=uncultured Psychroserpens sp. TaxID=255436 RepID=UPI00261987DF|nr:T9SS type A sorting domain-containing protein [uncultured Psychroserpens sp.]